MCMTSKDNRGVKQPQKTLNAAVVLVTVWGAVCQTCGLSIGCHRHPVLFWVKIYIMIFVKITWDVYGQDHLSIQNTQGFCGLLDAQNPKPESTPGSLTTLSQLTLTHVHEASWTIPYIMAPHTAQQASSPYC